MGSPGFSVSSINIDFFKAYESSEMVHELNNKSIVLITIVVYKIYRFIFLCFKLVLT